MITGDWRNLAGKGDACQQNRLLNEYFWPDIENSRGGFRTMTVTDEDKTGAKMILLANH